MAVKIAFKGTPSGQYVTISGCDYTQYNGQYRLTHRQAAQLMGALDAAGNDPDEYKWAMMEWFDNNTMFIETIT